MIRIVLAEIVPVVGQMHLCIALDGEDDERVGAEEIDEEVAEFVSVPPRCV